MRPLAPGWRPSGGNQIWSPPLWRRLEGAGLFEVLLSERWPDPYLDSGRIQLVHSAPGQRPPPWHVVRASGFLNLLQSVGRAVGDQSGRDAPLGIDRPKDGQSRRIE